jgi:hypothetical protein
MFLYVGSLHELLQIGRILSGQLLVIRHVFSLAVSEECFGLAGIAPRKQGNCWNADEMF